VSDFDGDGFQDIYFVNGRDRYNRNIPVRNALYRNQGDGTFADVTESAGLAVEMYAMGVAVADYDNDGLPDILVTAVGQNRLFHNTGKGHFTDVTQKAGLGGRSAFSTSAVWFDYDRDGHLDLFVCNYVKWAPEHDAFCSVDGKQKSYCTPEAYRGSTCWLFHNRGDGAFEEVTAASGIFDAASKSLGVALLDYDRDGWPDLLVTNDTQPNKLYRNLRNGTFEEIGVRAGVAFSEDGKARAGMGVDAADFENSGLSGIAITNFDNEMIALYRAGANGAYADIALKTGIGQASRNSLGFGCLFFDPNLDGRLDLIAVNGHIDATVRNIQKNTGYAQPPHLFLNAGAGQFRDVAREAGADFGSPKVARGVAFGDFDNDGDQDLLITTNQGPALLYRNDVTTGNRSLRLKLTGTKSNRDAIGTVARLFTADGQQTRMVKTGSSYLSQSELTLTFGLGRRDSADRIVVEWPSGRTEEFKAMKAGAYQIVEGTGIIGRQGR
ncbi:MAG: CRTAC1 family protein, partial [Deltaproteobacteria bacterium]|nr:CRTAC1 family protein [Deltaproteobacteria bacterium]